MKTFKLAIGDGFQRFLYPEDIINILEAKEFPEGSESALVKDALEKPIDSPQLSQMVSSKDKICIIFSDITRLWVRHHVFMPYILKELKKGEAKDENIYAICATGDHRAQTQEEFRKLLGNKTYTKLKGRIYNHSASRGNVCLGVTRLGTPVEIDERVVNADKVVLTGGIVYHFLDGWGGGKKAIMPGVSSRTSIMANHSLSLHPELRKGLDPNVCTGKMRGNRCSEDAVEVASFINPAFLLNVITDTKHKIGAAVAGNWIKAHEEGTKICEKYYSVPIKKLADLTIVSCGGYPHDINFYQTYKTLYNAERATNPGGAIILLSESREGMGNEDFYNMFVNYKNNEEREEALRKNYTIGAHVAFHETLMAEKFNILVISSLPNEQIKSAHMIPVKTVQEAIEKVKEILGNHLSLYVIPNGTIFLEFGDVRSK
jgi:nickel-dependent lactate racemase